MLVRIFCAFKSCVELIRQAIGRPPFLNPFKKYIVPVRVDNMMLAQRTGTLRKWYVQKLLFMDFAAILQLCGIVRSRDPLDHQGSLLIPCALTAIVTKPHHAPSSIIYFCAWWKLSSGAT
jgi:hypothetical protein